MPKIIPEYEIAPIPCALLRMKVVAHMLGIGETKAWELCSKGCLPTVKIGRSTRVPLAAVIEFVERLQSEQGA